MTYIYSYMSLKINFWPALQGEVSIWQFKAGPRNGICGPFESEAQQLEHGISCQEDQETRSFFTSTGLLEIL